MRRQRCSYCGGEFRCDGCGKLYQKCKCQIYESRHQNCHKTRSRPPSVRAKGILESNP